MAASARGVVPLLSLLVSPQSVLDLGCGKGEWLEALRPYCAELVGVDVAAPEGDGFIRHDLREPLDLERAFDLVLCLEVGEHLPAESADALVDSATRHSATVAWSAAVPGQEGTGHINCQPHAYWHSKFATRGYVVEDSIRPLIAHDRSVSSWYRSNTFLYVRAG